MAGPIVAHVRIMRPVQKPAQERKSSRTSVPNAATPGAAKPEFDMGKISEGHHEGEPRLQSERD